MRTRLRVICFASAMLAFFATLPSDGLAQTSTDGAEKQGAVKTAHVDEVEVRLVEQKLLARDRKGRSVTDLTAEELRVRDRIGNARVAYLTPLWRESVGVDSLPDVLLQMDVPDGTAEFSRTTGKEPRYVVILVDVENDPQLGTNKAAMEASRFVATQLDDSDRVSVLSYDGKLHEELPFSQDKAAAAQAVMNAYARPPRPHLDLRARIRNLISTIEECRRDGSSSFVRDANMRCLRDVSIDYIDEHRPDAEDFFDALQGVVRVVAGLRGQKIVLALSHGVASDPMREVLESVKAVVGPTDQVSWLASSVGPAEGAEFRLTTLFDFAIQQRVSLSFVDRSTAPMDSISASQSRANMPAAWPMKVAFSAPQDDLEKVARMTGGVFTASTNLYSGLSDTLETLAGAYVLGYYPNELLRPAELAKVKIRSSRPGIRLTYQRGFYPRETGKKIGGAIALGASHRVDKATPEDGPRRMRLPFEVQIDPRTLRYEEGSEEASGTFSLHVRVQNAAGRTLADSYHVITHAYPLDVWKSGEMAPVIVPGTVELTPGSFRLSAYVRSVREGLEGEFFRMLQVPADPPADPGES